MFRKQWFGFLFLVTLGVAQAQTVPFQPELRMYQHGDFWAYRWGGSTGRHGMKIQLVQVYDMPTHRTFRVDIYDAPNGYVYRSQPVKNCHYFVQMKGTGNVRQVLVRAPRTQPPPAPTDIGMQPLFAGTWNDAQVYGSHWIMKEWTYAQAATQPPRFLRTETVTVMGRTFQTRVYRFTYPSGDYNDYWYNTKLGNVVRGVIPFDIRQQRGHPHVLYATSVPL